MRIHVPHDIRIGFTISQVIFRMEANLCGILIRKMICEIVNPLLLPHPLVDTRKDTRAYASCYTQGYARVRSLI